MMRRSSMFLVGATLWGALAVSQAADVGVSVSISQPGVYGRIDIGRFPQPAVIVAEPVVIRPVVRPVAAVVQPIYLWVPPGHQKHWGKHCHRYQACGQPVYFVKDDWYHQHVMPKKAGRGHGHDKGHGHDHGKGKGKHSD
ncbi:MAG: hypothetical protein ACKVQR_06980 [Aquabacterium sp.]